MRYGENLSKGDFAMRTASEQADLRKLRRKASKLGYYIRTLPKRYWYVGDYAIFLNYCGGLVFAGSLDEIQDFLACESA